MDNSEYKVNAMLLSDYYKQGHAEFYPDGLNYLATYGTARMTRLDDIDHMVIWGIQGFAMKYLIEYFNDNFFNRPKAEVIDEIKEFIGETFVCPSFNIKKIEDLYDLGYLPVRLYALPEGSKAKIYNQKTQPGVVQVPFMMYENTDPRFAWVAEFLESITSANIWYPCLVATITHYGYRKIVDKHWAKSVVNQLAHTAISEFGFRGAEQTEGAVAASCAFLTSFDKTATVPAVLSMKHYYGNGVNYGKIGSGMNSTEHSVMCSNYAVDGDEETFIERLLSKISPTGNISVVSDSYDYWNMVTNILASEKIKNIIENRKGTLYVRGDSGNPADIICGTLHGSDYVEIEGLTEDGIEEYFKKETETTPKHAGRSSSLYTVRIGDYLYTVTCKHGGSERVGTSSGKCDYEKSLFLYKVREIIIEKILITPEMKGTIECLWDVYGGTVNEKGYKVLNSHIRGIYGDSITPACADDIYRRLEEKGFAANNVALGAGSFSMQAWESVEGSERVLKPYTRDTFGIAFKATYCEVDTKDGEVRQHNVFKQPKTDKASFKKSQRGMVRVYMGEDGEMHAEDHLNREQFNESIKNGTNLLRPIFENGKMILEEDIMTIRERLNDTEGF